MERDDAARPFLEARLHKSRRLEESDQFLPQRKHIDRVRQVLIGADNAGNGGAHAGKNVPEVQAEERAPKWRYAIIRLL